MPPKAYEAPGLGYRGQNPAAVGVFKNIPDKAVIRTHLDGLPKDAETLRLAVARKEELEKAGQESLGWMANDKFKGELAAVSEFVTAAKKNRAYQTPRKAQAPATAPATAQAVPPAAAPAAGAKGKAPPAPGTSKKAAPKRRQRTAADSERDDDHADGPKVPEPRGGQKKAAGGGVAGYLQDTADMTRTVAEIDRVIKAKQIEMAKATPGVATTLKAELFDLLEERNLAQAVEASLKANQSNNPPPPALQPGAKTDSGAPPGAGYTSVKVYDQEGFERDQKEKTAADLLSKWCGTQDRPGFLSRKSRLSLKAVVNGIDKTEMASSEYGGGRLLDGYRALIRFYNRDTGVRRSAWEEVTHKLEEAGVDKEWTFEHLRGSRLGESALAMIFELSVCVYILQGIAKETVDKFRIPTAEQWESAARAAHQTLQCNLPVVYTNAKDEEEGVGALVNFARADIKGGDKKAAYRNDIAMTGHLFTGALDELLGPKSGDATKKSDRLQTTIAVSTTKEIRIKEKSGGRGRGRGRGGGRGGDHGGRGRGGGRGGRGGDDAEVFFNGNCRRCNEYGHRERFCQAVLTDEA